MSGISGSRARIANIRIQHFDSNGNFLGEWGSIGTAEGQFGGILSIAVNSGTGDVFVADGDRVQRFDSAGQFELMWGKNVDPAGGAGPETCAAGCQEGEAGSAEGELRFPSGIATNANQVFVSENGNARISRFNATTGAFQLMGGADVVPGGGTGHEQCAAACKEGLRGSANGELDEPNGLDANGTFVWIVDTDNHRVQRWSNNLAFVNAFGTQGGGDGQFQRPERGRRERRDGHRHRRAAVAPAGLQRRGHLPGQLRRARRGHAHAPGGTRGRSGRRLRHRRPEPSASATTIRARSSAAGAARAPASASSRRRAERPSRPTATSTSSTRGNDRVQRFDSSGAALGTWGTNGTDPGQFHFPVDVAVAPDGSVYVLESSRVQKFTPIGGFAGTWGAPGDAPGQFTGASGVAVGPDGSVYVADTGNDRVQKFSGEGQLLAMWGSEGTGDGQFASPRDVAVDGAGNVYVVDRNAHRVQRFTADGVFRDRFGAGGGDGTLGAGPGEFNSPVSIAVDTHGYVYVVEQFNHRVQKFVGTPELVVTGAPRQRLKELVVTVACGSGPCDVSVEREDRGEGTARREGSAARVSGRSEAQEDHDRARRRSRLTLDAGATADVSLKPAKKGKRWRKAKALLKDGGRGKVTVDGAVANEAGAGSSHAPPCSS